MASHSARAAAAAAAAFTVPSKFALAASASSSSSFLLRIARACRKNIPPGPAPITQTEVGFAMASEHRSVANAVGGRAVHVPSKVEAYAAISKYFN